MANQDILNSLSTNTQIPLDSKTYFKTLATLSDLGASNNRAFKYYENMIVQCIENNKEYIWREWNNLNEPGLLPQAFEYPPNSIVDGIDYSNRFFNFFEYQIFTDTQIDRLKDSVYENISQTISVSPPSFEKGVSTNLTFTWRVTKNDDTLNTVTVDGVDKISEATGINRTYEVNNQVASRSVALVTNLTRNTVTGSTFTLTNSVTSNAYVPQFKGQLADSLAADSYILADLSELTKLIQPGVGMSLADDFTNKYGVIITKTEINKIVFSVAPEPLSIGNWDDGTSYFYKKSITLTLANGGTETMFLYRTRQLLNATTTFIIS